MRICLVNVLQMEEQPPENQNVRFRKPWVRKRGCVPFAPMRHHQPRRSVLPGRTGKTFSLKSEMLGPSPRCRKPSKVTLQVSPSVGTSPSSISNVWTGCGSQGQTVPSVPQAWRCSTHEKQRSELPSSASSIPATIVHPVALSV